ncbi:MAG: ankyrin repeat domain-containing protein [Amoebophilaceae bacterium]|nr:ankyrin repeat domain-containing protein [Amoebophilaceae bacterium]
MKKNRKNRFQPGIIYFLGYSVIILWSSGCNSFTTNYKLLEREPTNQEAIDSEEETDSEELPANVAALLEAVQHGHVEGLRSLIAKGTCVNTPNVSGLYPLHLCTQAAHQGVAMATLLLEKGANPNVQNASLCTPLYYAVDNERLDMVILLAQRGADINIKNSWSDAPIHVAISYKNREITEYLIKNRTDIHTKNSYKETPLYLAVESEEEEIVRLLREKMDKIT